MITYFTKKNFDLVILKEYTNGTLIWHKYSINLGKELRING